MMVKDWISEMELRAENNQYLRSQRKGMQERGDRAIDHKPVKVRQKEAKK